MNPNPLLRDVAFQKKVSLDTAMLIVKTYHNDVHGGMSEAEYQLCIRDLQKQIDKWAEEAGWKEASQ